MWCGVNWVANYSSVCDESENIECYFPMLSGFVEFTLSNNEPIMMKTCRTDIGSEGHVDSYLP